VLFTASRKLDLATALRERMEERKLRLPQRPELRADLHSVTRSVGATGAPRLGAERTDAHADRFWALALACAAAQVERPDISLWARTDERTATARLAAIERTPSAWGTVRSTAHAGW
jgi:phage FluMu gp28-like protein